MTTASALLAMTLTAGEISAAATADAAAGKVGPDCAGILQAAKEDIRAAKIKLGIVSAHIGAGTNKTAVDAMVTALT